MVYFAVKSRQSGSIIANLRKNLQLNGGWLLIIILLIVLIIILIIVPIIILIIILIISLIGHVPDYYDIASKGWVGHGIPHCGR